MKIKSTITACILSVLLFAGCDDNDDDQIVIDESVNLIDTQYPEKEQELFETWAAIEQSLRDGDMDKLISFHGYSPKFTEYKNGEAVNDGAANEAYERSVFGAVTEVVKFDTKDFKVAVYGDVANMTFQTDFHLKFGADLVIVNEQTTLLFVNTEDGWKIVHEHHSPWTP